MQCFSRLLFFIFFTNFFQGMNKRNLRQGVQSSSVISVEECLEMTL